MLVHRVQVCIASSRNRVQATRVDDDNDDEELLVIAADFLSWKRQGK